MKKYKVDLCLGNYTMSAEFESIASAFGCIDQIDTCCEHAVPDLDRAMIALVDMERDLVLKHSAGQYSIARIEVDGGE